MKTTCTNCGKQLPEEMYTHSKQVCDVCYTRRVRYKTSREYVEELSPLHIEEDGVYAITSVSPNTPLNRVALKLLEALVANTQGRLICIGTKSHQRPLKDEPHYYPQRIAAYLQRVVELPGTIVGDFRVNPQQINPLSSIDRIGGSLNVGVASPKQHSTPLPVGNNGIRRLFSLGSLSDPNYRATEKTGIIAENSHKIGATVVEIRGGKTVDICPIEVINNTLVYKRVVYTATCKTAYIVEVAQATEYPKVVVFGDLHLDAHDNSFSYTTIMKMVSRHAEAIVLHDVTSGSSVTHHSKGKPLTRPTYGMAHEIRNVIKLFQELLEESPEREIILPACNHDKHIEDYVKSGQWVNDDLNRDCCIAMLPFIKSSRPLMDFIKSSIPEYSERIIVLRPDEVYMKYGVDLANHGHAHASGKRGSIDLFDKSHGRCIIGHSHTAQWRNNAWSVGRWCPQRLGYNEYADVSQMAYISIYESGVREIFVK